MKQNKIKRSAILMIGLFSLWLAASPGFCEAPAFEVVSSIPLGTNISRAGTRDAALVWLEMIRGARQSLDFAEYYLVGKSGETLEPVVEAILIAARRGVRVRIMTETGMAENSKDLLELLRRQPGIEITIFNWQELTGGILHAKYFIVDEKEVYIGSQNFDWRSLAHIQETGLRIHAPLFVQALRSIFAADWQYCCGDKTAYQKLAAMPPLHFLAEAYLVASPARFNPPGIRDALETLVALLDSARSRITVQLLSYSLEIAGSREQFTLIDEALRRAAQRGVRVQMLVSDWNLNASQVKGLQKLVLVPNVEVKFAVIPPGRGGFIPYARVVHSKVMRIDDDISWVGTSNWGYDYFFKSRNIETVLRLPAVARVLDEIFASLWNGPYVQRLEPGKKYTPPRIN